MHIFTQEEVEENLSDLSVNWAIIDGVHLERVYEFEDFSHALKFVDKVGALSNGQNHHPEIRINNNKVVLLLTTHEQNGITGKDFKLAKEIEKLN